MQEIEHGGLLYETSENDYLLGADGLEIEIKKRRAADDSIVEYDQLDLPNGTNSCTIHANVGAVSDLTEKVYSLEERQALWDSALALDASETQGWYFYKAVDHIRKNWNASHPNDRLVTFRLRYDQPEFKLALERKHALVGGYRGNKAYNDDASDGRLEGTSFGATTYGHCIRLRQRGEEVEVVDNYAKHKKNNRYSLSNLKELIANKVFFDEFYLFLPFSTMTKDERTLLKAKELGFWSGERPNDTATRSEVMLMAMRVAGLDEKDA